MPRILLLLLLTTLASGCADFPTSGPGYFVVDTTEDLVDASPGDLRCRTARGNCSLRAAIMESNAMPGANTVKLSGVTYTLRLAGRDAGAEAGDLDVTGSVQVLGAGVGKTLIDGNRLVTRDRIFHLLRERLNLLDLTLQNGGDSFIDGGAIRTEGGVLALRRVAVRDNTSPVHGAGLYNNGLAEIEDTTFTGNQCDARGGAISNGARGILAMVRSTLDHNSANLGGAINNEGDMTLSNVTVSTNTGSTGPGGIYNTVEGRLRLNNVTVAFNQNNGETHAAGLANESSARVELSNTILADNQNRGSQADDCSGTLVSDGHNLISGGACLIVGDGLGNVGGISRLQPLANNGGPTQTHALGLGSPALEGGNPDPAGNLLTGCEPTDQRGVARPRGRACDIGALEQ